MFTALARKMFGSANDRLVRQFQPLVDKINALEPAMQALDDAALRGKTAAFRQRLHDGADLDSLLPEAFAVVREGAKRALGLRPFDVQLVGGIVLHRGMISEMKTGEGKTLVATLPVYLNALTGRGVHVVTVNDYLARRDAEWMGKLYNFLGLSVGCITNELEPEQRRVAYRADITYATNNELGFDYLRDNMRFSLEQMVLRDLHFAVIDEVDSILVDEARTPLIISGPAEVSTELYGKVDAVIKILPATCYEIDEKHRSLTLSELGQEQLEEKLRDAGLLLEGGLYDVQNVHLLHHGLQGLKAHHLFSRDRDYIVKDRKVIIIDEFTGRMMEGRRYSDGLHQAIEAKEFVPVQRENQTLASITFQNYFRLYDKIAGMTGTAMTEAAEFEEIYKLRVVEIPTNIPVSRKDEQDTVYRFAKEKNEAIVTQIEECHARQQPVLVGTVSIAKSEELAALLKSHKIPHAVLNARYHEQEAEIIVQAGRPGAVTIATNMAGRGTDIQLGGNLEKMLLAVEPDQHNTIEAQHAADKQIVLNAGGLYVIGTERHESRRIDNQLRGRSGRQGDPGQSKFYLSLEDDLMRIFGSERMDAILGSLGMKADEPISHNFLNRAIEKAQRKVEERNFDMRKTLLKFDDVMNDQRQVIYEQRREIMESQGVSDLIDEFREQMVSELVAAHIPAGSYAQEWDAAGLENETRRIFDLDLPIQDWAREEGVADDVISKRLLEATAEKFTSKRAAQGSEMVAFAEKSLLLQLLDQHWKDHLLALDHLRQGINLRAYGQRDPLNEYKREAFEYFEDMLGRVREQVLTMLSRVEIHTRPLDIPEPDLLDKNITLSRTDRFAPIDSDAPPPPALPAKPVITRHHSQEEIDPKDPATWGRTQRNAPCPCGSGKKYKQCHGALG